MPLLGTALRSPARFAAMSILSCLIGLTTGGCAQEECEALRPPLVHLDGRTYTADLAAPAVSADEIGDVVFEVARDRSSAISSCDWDPIDGDSSLPVGTEFHSIVGVNESQELAAIFEGRFIRFST